jgi:hypothetical protein
VGGVVDDGRADAEAAQSHGQNGDEDETDIVPALGAEEGAEDGDPAAKTVIAQRRVGRDGLDDAAMRYPRTNPAVPTYETLYAP